MARPRKILSEVVNKVSEEELEKEILDPIAFKAEMSEKAEKKRLELIEIQKKINDGDNGIWQILTFNGTEVSCKCQCIKCRYIKEFTRCSDLWRKQNLCSNCLEMVVKSESLEGEFGEMKYYPIHEISNNGKYCSRLYVHGTLLDSLLDKKDKFSMSKYGYRLVEFSEPKSVPAFTYNKETYAYIQYRSYPPISQGLLIMLTIGKKIKNLHNGMMYVKEFYENLQADQVKLIHKLEHHYTDTINNCIDYRTFSKTQIVRDNCMDRMKQNWIQPFNSVSPQQMTNKTVFLKAKNIYFK